MALTNPLQVTDIRTNCIVTALRGLVKTIGSGHTAISGGIGLPLSSGPP